MLCFRNLTQVPYFALPNSCLRETLQLLHYHALRVYAEIEQKQILFNKTLAELKQGILKSQV